jgi:hypothetical protein
MTRKPQESDTDSEVAQRLDRALQRAFAMPHKKHEPIKTRKTAKARRKKER